MKRKRIDIITLGCSKNLVDSEQLMRQLEEAGYSVTHDTENPAPATETPAPAAE